MLRRNFSSGKAGVNTNDKGPTPPLLLFLHGGVDSGDDLEMVKTHGPPKEIEAGRDFVISPLNPDKKGFWDEAMEKSGNPPPELAHSPQERWCIQTQTL
ncbi:MAG: hypothetical protein ACSHYF_06580 [Verrucomicrobiaceae bacterium]